MTFGITAQSPTATIATHTLARGERQTHEETNDATTMQEISIKHMKK